LKRPEVKELIARGLGEVEATAARTLLEICRVAFGDTCSLFDDDHQLKPFRELTPAQRAMGKRSTKTVCGTRARLSRWLA